jgi:hypothetical protein
MSILHNTSGSGLDPLSKLKPLHSPFLTEQLTNDSREWKTGQLSYEYFQAYEAILEKYPQVKTMDRDAQYKFFIERKNEIIREVAERNREDQKLEKDLKNIQTKKIAIETLLDWGTDLKIQRPDGVSFRKMRKAFAEDRTIYLDKSLHGVTPKLDFEKEIFRFAEILLIEHDWAAAFKNADLADSVVKLPYDVCAFEFQFSDRPVIALATQFGTDIAFTPVVLIDDWWVTTDITGCIGQNYADDNSRDAAYIRLFAEIDRQIRAACISLDAEVAKAEVVREPHTGQHGRNSHQMLKPYHVVSLARRGARPLASVGTETGRRVRLHFRRGHWRHFEAHKTWVKWCLCGDPDLGFIDKHYKL